MFSFFTLMTMTASGFEVVSPDRPLCVPIFGEVKDEKLWIRPGSKTIFRMRQERGVGEVAGLDGDDVR